MTHDGIVRLAPCWVPRQYNAPGRRLRLQASDLYAYGAQRGCIAERWLASVTKADNGPGTLADEGLSYVEHGGRRMLLQEFLKEAGETWDVLAKFFDNYGPIGHHMHQRAEHASLVGQKPKPEAYYFPPQLNHTENSFPYSFLGLTPGTTRQDIRRCLMRWNQGDNGILWHSPAYRLKPGTGWQIDPGVLHAPGTLVTYEVQGASDVGAVFQSVVNGRAMPWNALVKDVPLESREDLDFILDMLDWEANLDPLFAQKRRFEPKVSDESDEFSESWVVYSTALYSAKELTVYPRCSVTLKDAAAYGCIAVQGHGTLGSLEVEAPGVIRFGHMTRDEFFVTSQAARDGVRIENRGGEDLVLLKHFGPGNSEAAELIDEIRH